MNSKWDKRFIKLAQEVASWSKDPSTQVGAVLVRPDRTIASVGYNGFPRGVEDHEELYEDRSKKYPRVVHAELNAVLSANGDTKGNTLYCTLYPCSECAKAIIQTGIKTVVVTSFEKPERLYEAMMVSEEMFSQAGVELRIPHEEHW